MRRLSDDPITPARVLRDVNAQRMLCYALDGLLSDWVGRGNIDPLSVSTIPFVPPVCRPVAILLAVLHCRYSDLESVDLRQVMRGEHIQITPRKRGIPHLAEPAPHREPAYWRHVDPDAPLAVISYHTMCTRLRTAYARAAIPHVAGIHHGTHVYRHLWASWRMSQGDDPAVIATGLGQRSQSSVASYIHDAYYPLIV